MPKAFDVVLPGTRTAEKKHTRAIGIQNVDALRIREACTRCPTASSDDLLATRNADVLYTRVSGIRGVDALQVRAARTGRPKAFNVDMLATRNGLLCLLSFA